MKNNIWIITAREYLSRVKKRSFIIMTLLTPLLIAGFYGLIIWVSVSQTKGTEEKKVVVVDESKQFDGLIENQGNLKFYFKENFSTTNLLESDSIDGLLVVPAKFNLDETLTMKYESKNSLSVSENDDIQDAFRNVIKQKKLEKMGVSQATIDSLRSRVVVSQFKVDEEGNVKSSNLGINTGLGMGLSLVIYFFIFLYGVQVMRGVIEEKTNRIVELIVSTVKPFQLMLGKVIGIAAVGLTQLGIWIILTSILTTVISVVFGLNMTNTQELSQMAQNPATENMSSVMAENIAAFFNLPLGRIFTTFLFYFLGGYLFYGALFAAIGSAVDSETDTQQFMMPITLPLVFSFAISFSLVIGDPHGTLATWLSIIPISSPIVMMVRMPFGPPTWELIVSMVVLLASIVGVIFLAGKIYKTGILMYGKKPTYKELAKWLFYKN
jgi:ABC-2 type transport system permease protein